MRPRAALEHVGHRGARHHHGPAQVHVEGGLPLLLGDVLDDGVPHDAGVVHDHVDPAPLLGHPVEQPLHREAVGHVDGEGQGLAAAEADLLGGARDAGGVPVEKGQLGPRLGEDRARWPRRCRCRRR